MKSSTQDILDLAIRIQQIPAPTFHEEVRARFIRDLFEAEGLKDVEMDSVSNVFARLPGRNKKTKPLIVSAHLDTVFPGSVNLQVKEEAVRVFGPGLGDNSLGVAALFGLVRILRQNHVELKQDLWLVANAGEEGLGDLCGMREVVGRFGADVTGYLILEGLAYGHIYHRAIGVQRYRIHARTAGGHSWSDYGQPSAVHEMASLITKLTSIKLPKHPRTTMNVGVISGGTGINVLAAEAKCELDLRSEDPAVLARIAAQAEEYMKKANRPGVKIDAEIIGQRPAGAVDPQHDLVQLAVQHTRASGISPMLTAGSTDANIPLSMGIPAVVMGISTGGNAHTLNEYVDVEPINRGMDAIAAVVKDLGS